LIFEKGRWRGAVRLCGIADANQIELSEGLRLRYPKANEEEIAMMFVPHYGELPHRD
jgi:hypothetical protein